MSQPEETARRDDPVESSSPEDDPEAGIEERLAPRQDPAENSELEGAPRGDLTP